MKDKCRKCTDYSILYPVVIVFAALLFVFAVPMDNDVSAQSILGCNKTENIYVRGSFADDLLLKDLGFVLVAPAPPPFVELAINGVLIKSL